MAKDGKAAWPGGTGKAGSAMAGMVAAALALGWVVPAAGTTPDAAMLYRQAMAGTKSWTVHYVSTSDARTVKLAETGDAGPASGTQQVLIGAGNSAETASLIVIGQITYFKGNALSLEHLLGLSSSQAAASSGQWAQFSSASPAFSQVVAGVRSQDVAQELVLHGPFSLGAARMLGGYEVDAVRGTQAGQGATATPAVLFVRASGRHLPVEEDTVSAQGRPNGAIHIVLSQWGEQVRPRAPAATITIGPMHAA